MARFPFLNADGTFQSAQVKTQLDARTDARMRDRLPTLAEELGIGATGVPIFATLAEAEEWEAANPGKKALTLEPSTPDTTAPTAGSLSVTTSQTSATLTVSGAADDRGVAGYAFKVGSGAWSAWQDSGSYTASGLTHSTSYTFQHKVKDAAGNETLGASVVKSTTAAPVADTTAPTWSASLTAGTPTETSVVVTASALATDNVGVTGYEVTYNGTAWSSITPSGSNFTLTGTAGTTYSSTKLRAKDAAGNASAPLAVPTYTMNAPAVQAGDVLTSDAFTLYADGSLVNGKFTDATLGGAQQTYGVAVNADGAVYQGGALSWAKRAIVTLPLTREDKEVSCTVKALSTTTDKFYLSLRVSGTKGTRFVVNPSGGWETLLQGPAGDISGPRSSTGGVVKAGSVVTFGVKGDAGYVVVDGVRTEIPSLQGNTGGVLAIDNGAGGAIDNLVVKAL